MQKIANAPSSFFVPHSHPPHTIIKLPNLSPTMETGTVVSWAKNEGDEVNEGDLLAEIETDKATMSFDASDAGFLAKILAPAGSKDIPVGTPLCVVVEDADSISAFKEFKADVSTDSKATIPVKPVETKKSASPPPPTPTSPVPPIPTPQPKSASQTVQTGRVFASPLARRLAAEQSIDLSQLASTKSGSGIRGSFRAADLVGVGPTAAITAAPVLGTFTDVPVTTMRSGIAKRMTSSQLDIPHYYLTADVNVDQLIQMRDDLNAVLKKRGPKDEDGFRISLNDILIKAAAMTCLRVPECNSSWQGDYIRQYHTVDMNVAVATPVGLITPVLFGAESKGLLQISQEIHDLVRKAQENSLQQNEFQVGTFTISNLGAFGINSFSAIINPPQACLLAVGSPHQQVCSSQDSPDGYTLSNVASFTLCCDHRVVDGAVGASWLAEFKSTLEKPALMLM